jgi:tRNA(Ile)-lysidine synthase
MNDTPVLLALRGALERFVPDHDRLGVAYSGGLDSSVLLHGLSRLVELPRLYALHVDHGLQPDSAQWAAACARHCERIGIPLRQIRVAIDPAAPGGPEARARDARYAALHAELAANDVLVTAHHEQDQAETLLLQLMRGAGPTGLAAMRPFQVSSGIRHLRPLLAVSPDDIRAYALMHALEWVEDPSNAELDFDRNFMRHEVLPLLSGRWPAAARVIARSARLCALVADDAAAVAGADLLNLLDRNRLDLERLRNLPAARRSEALRAALRGLGLAIPSARQLELALEQLLGARDDAAPLVRWPGVGIRRYRGTAWLYSEAASERFDVAPRDPGDWDYREPAELGAVAGRLEAVEEFGRGIGLDYLDAVLTIRFRRGGERLRVRPGGRHRPLKKLLQETDVVPWMRRHIPLIYSGERLLAVGDLWVTADAAAAPGARGLSLKWHSNYAYR